MIPRSTATPRPPRVVTVALLIDRDQDTRAMYRQWLALDGWAIEEAEDGREGLAKALSLQPDIVVTATRLSGIDGFELCQLLRRDGVTHDTPIVVLTGDAFDAAVVRAKASGADAVLVKPCLPDVLRSEMRRLMEDGRALRDRAARLRNAGTTPVAGADDTVEPSVAADGPLTGRLKTARAPLKTRAALRTRAPLKGRPPLVAGDSARVAQAPSLVCPACDRKLTFQRSHLGGVGTKLREQWDYFECPGGCGVFQYRHRTRKIRKVA